MVHYFSLNIAYSHFSSFKAISYDFLYIFFMFSTIFKRSINLLSTFIPWRLGRPVPVQFSALIVSWTSFWFALCKVMLDMI